MYKEPSAYIMLEKLGIALHPAHPAAHLLFGSTIRM